MRQWKRPAQLQWKCPKLAFHYSHFPLEKLRSIHVVPCGVLSSDDSRLETSHRFSSIESDCGERSMQDIRSRVLASTRDICCGARGTADDQDRNKDTCAE